MGRFGIGNKVERMEDNRFLRGEGKFLDDLPATGQLHAGMLRSPHAHARISAIDTAAAQAAAGVIAVFTGADLDADGIADLPTMAGEWVELSKADGTPAFLPPRPLLAKGMARFAGEAVAMVVAETRDAMASALELIEVEYEPLLPIVDPSRARGGDAPQIWDEGKGNTSFVFAMGEEEKTAKAFDVAAHVVPMEIGCNRVVPSALECRGAIGTYADGAYDLYIDSQNLYDTRAQVAECLGVEAEKVRVRSDDVGGGFGAKFIAYPEHILVVWAAKKLGKPVRWTSARSEAFLCDIHARDLQTKGELALDDQGRFTALRVDSVANLGAYASSHGPVCPTVLFGALLAGAYTTPMVFARVSGVFTNTPPLDAYRGCGQPEAMNLLERMVEAAARKLGVSSEEIRRRNFVAAERMPFTGATALEYDSGSFEAGMDAGLATADWAGFEERRKASSQAGRLRGIGLATYVEMAAASPREVADVVFEESGNVTLHIGTKSSGQGHETTFAQVLNEELDIPFDRITVVEGDTARLPHGGGSGGSRSAQMGSTAIHIAADKIRQKATQIASHVLEVAEADIEIDEGSYRVVGTDRAIELLEIAELARDAANLPNGMEPGLDERGDADLPTPTFPNGCHVCEVEVDPDTGRVTVERYVTVGDFGRILNPMLLEGQVQGGVAQGIGQALLEQTVFDDDGQLLSGSFMDYCMPRADDLPAFECEFRVVPCTTNPLGVKGAGESGAIAALPAVMNALVDALSPLGVTHIEMPATPERVWRAINEARAT